MTIHLSTTARNASTDAALALINANGPGSIRIYSGTQPANGDAAAAGTLLATVVLGNPAFAASTSGTATGADPAAVNPTGTGTASWFRVVNGSGTGVFDGSVSATGSGGDMTLSSTSLAPGVSVDITALSYSTPA